MQDNPRARLHCLEQPEGLEIITMPIFSKENNSFISIIIV
jgi:hypothetical protein